MHKSLARIADSITSVQGTYRVGEVDSHQSHTSVHNVGKHGEVLTGRANGSHNLGKRESLGKSLGVSLQSDDLREARGHGASDNGNSTGSEHSSREIGLD